MYWNPNDHPRGSDGRFIEKINALRKAGVDLPYDKHGSLNEMELDRRYEALRIPLDFFGEKNDYSNEPIPEMPKEVFGFAEKERKNTAHHIKHRIKMGYKDQDVYEAAGVEFWKKGKGKIYYSLKRKVFIRYDEKTLKSCYVSCDGFLKTYFLFRSKKEAEQYMKQDFWKEIK